jgi:hypothetical protein
MTPPTIQALGIRQLWSPTYWQATSYVEGLGWLEAYGRSMLSSHGGVAGPGC